MIDAIIKEISEISLSKGDYPFFPETYKPFLINKKKFYRIEPFNSKRSIVFVDGGNSAVFETPSLSLHIMRLAAVFFKNNARFSQRREEFYSLIKVIEEKERFYYNTKAFSQKTGFIPEEKDMVFDMFDKSLTNGKNRLDINRIGSFARRLSEIKFASEVAKNLEDGDIVVVDGTLESFFPGEKKCLEELYRIASERNVLVAALSKTTNLLTNKGGTLTAALEELSPDESWYYHPVAESNEEKHRAEIYFVKLHKDSNYIFRFEIYKEQSGLDIMPVLGILAANSKDVSFPGYPYGLMLADHLARVRKKEISNIKARFLAKADSEWANVQKHFSLNAHEILDVTAPK